MKLKGKDLSGAIFSRLTVIKQVGIDKKSRQKLWLCKCECGNYKTVKTSYLTSGDTRSCGCLRKESELENLKKCLNDNKKHGLSTKRIYFVWADMKNRCMKSSSKAYKNYGGRGIKVCDEWLDKENGFINFYNWAMQNGYRDDLTIDRIDNNGNYDPSNCRWATPRQQANNRRITRKIEIYGELKTAYEFEKQYGIKQELLIDRYDKGYRNDKLIFNGNLGHFRKTNLKRDSKGRFLKR